MIPFLSLKYLHCLLRNFSWILKQIAYRAHSVSYVEYILFNVAAIILIWLVSFILGPPGHATHLPW